MITEQEFYDKTIEHLVNQGVRALGFPEGAKGNEVCLYRGPNNTKCAVGFWIPDELYSPQMEGMGVGRLIDENPKIADFIPNTQLARRLQELHDEYMMEGDWKPDFENFAKRIAESFNLIPYSFGA